MPEQVVNSSASPVGGGAASSWSAPCADGAVHATVRVPGSKSETARALYVAAIAQAPSTIVGALDSRDTRLMIGALTALGAGIERGADDSLMVTPIRDWASGEVTIDTGLAGTVMRFVPLLAALRPGVTHFVGDAEAEARPLAPLLDLVRALGAHVECHGQEGFLPFTVHGISAQAPVPTTLVVEASASSQFLSAALLVAPMLVARDGQPRRIETRGDVVSLPHVLMTCQMLADCGVNVETTHAPAFFTISPTLPRGGVVAVAPDLTNAGVFLAAGMLCGGRVTILDWPASTSQAGDAWRDFFTRLGAKVSHDGRDLHLSVAPSAGGRPEFAGVDMDFSAIGELTPTAVAVLLFASTPSQLRGVAHIRGHETDRLAALAQEIRRLGGSVTEFPDGLAIEPAALHGADLRAYADHRMATFAALVGLRLEQVTVDDIGATSKTLPDFPAMWQRLCQGLTPAASGSTDPTDERGGE